MRRYWYRRILIMVLVFAIAAGGSWYLIESERARLEAEVNADTSDELLIPGGMPVGIYLETEGALVLGTEKIEGDDGRTYEPAARLVKKGDYIIGLDNETITNKTELVEAVAALDKEEVVLTVRRDGQKLSLRMKAVSCGREGYKLGIWVRDNAQGLGTVTFLSGNSCFGALGHGIRDTDTGELLDAADGLLYTTSIQDIKKGKDGMPGGMEGVIIYNNYNILGTIEENTEEGIYGKLNRVDTLFAGASPMEPMQSLDELHEGQAVIRCAVSGTVEDYQIRITKIDSNAQESNKRIMLEITDEKLLDLTGGIVQGMSGSPIIQDGKIAGAVTHVLVNSPEEGYGIFIQDMLKHIES